MYQCLDPAGNTGCHVPKSCRLPARCHSTLAHIRAMRQEEEAAILEYSKDPKWVGSTNHHARLVMVRKLAVKEWAVATR